jgi:predicted SAM-dependent methyltransferase
MSGERLHLGSGPEILDGWTNIDVRPYPGVDRVLDLREGLPFDEVSFIFAEHFLEHLELEDAWKLLRECRRALADDGVLRLTTPNLDWVWATSYSSRWKAESEQRATIDVQEWKQDSAAARDCVGINQAFRAWGHRFLYNAAMLEALVREVGFARVDWCDYGRSEHEVLRGIERHERSPDIAGLPHVLVVEASGRAQVPVDGELQLTIDRYLRDRRVE